MRVKHLFAGVLLTTAIGAVPVLAQPMTPPGGSPLVVPTMPPGPIPAVTLPSYPAAAIANPAPGVQPVSPSAADWLNSPCLCNGPTGRNGPIGSEIFLLTGPTIPGGPAVQARYANTGWMAEVGARTLLFNASGNAAWTAMLALSYQYNDGNGRVAPFGYFNDPGIPVTIRDLHRYAFNFGGGRDWFLMGRDTAGCNGTNLRVGLETGGRWGGEHVNLNLIIDDPTGRNNFLEKYHVYGGYFIATHADLELPMGSWVWFGGFRAEWGVNFGTVIPFQNNTLMDVNLLLSTGFRY